jgi:tRNA pseudouridine13 synthase
MSHESCKTWVLTNLCIYRDYVLGGSYRKILHHPRDLSWKIYHYTDPEVPLAQADEDELIGLPPPVTGEGEDTEGKFKALQIKLQLGTAAYATMALREVLKTDTSSQHQSSLTQSAEDQHYKGTDKAGTSATDALESVAE